MNVEAPVSRKGHNTPLMAIDCDIHPNLPKPDSLDPYLPAQWVQHRKEYGYRTRTVFTGASVFPKVSPALARRDSWPPEGGPPGSSLSLLRSQHLDPNNISYGVLQLMRPDGGAERNPLFGEALCSAANDWQVAALCEPEPRLKGGILVPYEDADAAVKEIDRCMRDNRHFVQVSIPPRTGDPVGSRKYWPIYAAAERYGLPIGMHTGGVNGVPITGSGWPSYYFEDHFNHAMSVEYSLINLVMEGVFAAFPSLKVVMMEGGFAWVPAMAWRLDRQWEKSRSELPHLKEPPSAYIRRNIWFTTQPMDESERPGDMADIIDWVGVDRIMFASDYPHWDFDDPELVFRTVLDRNDRVRIMTETAREVFGLV